ncbi:MAG TPA: hypothetical protein PLG41_24275 [Leptospiraceae bacterium]|nr:hypothetical protein [Leptospiraceae bacterium]
MIRSIPILFSEIPVRKTFTLKEKDYEFYFQYNERFNFVTVTISQDNEILFTSKLVYGSNFLFGSNTDIPYSLVPISDDDLSRSGYSNLKVNSETLGKTIAIYFDDGV